MQMSQFMSTDFLTRIHMDPTRNPNPVDCEDRLSSVNDGHVAPTSPCDKEAMFEKPLTPSDVGKLNRLVIPKLYAEKYFPLGGGGDVAGTLLGFEDESGKCWKFRYSYWNSSQSYVLTKGWSRYVKEKSLHAGDVVVFERHRSDLERLFIGWRRRGVPPAFFSQSARGQGYGGESLRLSPYQAQRQRHGNGGREVTEVTTPATIGLVDNNNSTRLVRLFGVNLECQLNDNTTSSHSSSQPILTRQQEAYRNYFNYLGLPANHLHLHQHMDIQSDQG